MNPDFIFICRNEVPMNEWRALRAQILSQWERIREHELDHAGPDNRKIAQLIAHKYDIPREQVEYYLLHFERTSLMAAN